MNHTSRVGAHHVLFLKKKKKIGWHQRIEEEGTSDLSEPTRSSWLLSSSHHTPFFPGALCLCSYLLAFGAQMPRFRPVCSFPSESRTAASLCPCIKAVQEGCVSWRTPLCDWSRACCRVSSVTWFQRMAEAGACLWQPLKAARGTKNLMKILFYWSQDILVSAESWVLSVLSEERCFPVGRRFENVKEVHFLLK